jgi:hypothetical protein
MFPRPSRSSKALFVEKVRRPTIDHIEIYLGTTEITEIVACFLLGSNDLSMQVQPVIMII